MRKTTYAFLIGLVSIALFADHVCAEIEGIQLQVDGLSCPFCAIGIQKQLKQTGGLEEIEVHLKQGVTEARLPLGKGIDVGKVRRAVQEAGFTLRGIKLAVTGYVTQANGHLAITSRGDRTQFLLFDPKHREAESDVFLEDPLRRKLEQAREAGSVVRVSGAVHEHQGLPPALMIETLEAVPE